MKKISILVLFSMVITVNLTAQFGWTKIYDQQVYGIYRTQVFPNQNLTSSILYIQLNTNNAEQNNDAGRVYKMNKNTLQFFNTFQGGFDRVWYFTPFPIPGFHISLQNTFCISLLDTSLAIRNFVSGCGLDCGDHTYITTNYGSNWVNLTQFGNDFLGTQSRGFDIDPFNASIIYSAYPRIGSNNWLIIYKSTDKGTSWAAIDSIQADTYSIPQGYTKINPFRSNYLYIRGFNNLLISSNSGTKFAPVSNSASFAKLEFNRFDTSIIAYNATTFYKSADHGASWSKLSWLPDPVRCLALSPSINGLFYAGTDYALYKSADGGLNWIIYNDSFTPSKALIGITMDQGMGDTVFVVTRDAVYKVWGGYVSVKQISSNVPEQFSLSQNYPNPFNPLTKIKFDVPAGRNGNREIVKIIVFDILGKEIEVLVNEELSPGTYEVDFEGSNLPSGVYYYKLEVSDPSTPLRVTETKKMVLVK